MNKRVAALSFDVEQDCPPYLATWRGIEEGLPRLLQLLDEANVKATFFFTGEALQRYPALARRVLDEGHELGVHGFRHERLDRLPRDDACRAIAEATRAAAKVLGETPAGFRAPNLQLPKHLLGCLASLGYRYDSSMAWYKPPFRRKPFRVAQGLVEIPVTLTSSVLRLPPRLQRLLMAAAGSPLILFAHPWEYIDMSGSRVRWDCRFNTGERAAELLRGTIGWLRGRGYRLLRLEDYVEELDDTWRGLES